jgi:type IV pilus assembly protein PilE
MATDLDFRAAAGARLAARRGQAGFTLIELAIVCVVVSILAAMAVTGFRYATIKARRGAAQGCLTEAAQFMERWYTTEQTYAGVNLPTCSSDVTEFYTLNFSVAPTAGGYTLQAVPQGAQAEEEKDCGTMTIDHAGRKTPAAGCW